jgi:hypothetical protein
MRSGIDSYIYLNLGTTITARYSIDCRIHRPHAIDLDHAPVDKAANDGAPF